MKATSTSLFLLAALSIGIGLAAVPQRAEAATIAAVEYIDDRNPANDARNLRRIRFDGYTLNFTGNDAVIENQNQIDADFGFFNANDVTYAHRIGWLGVKTFTGGLLEIFAGGVGNGPGPGDNDNVRIEAGSVFLGPLNAGTGWTMFELTGPQITAFLADNVLDVFINKRPNDPGDQIEVRASVLTLSYEVPDSGSTLVLLVCSVLAVEGLRRRMAAFKRSVEA